MWILGLKGLRVPLYNTYLMALQLDVAPNPLQGHHLLMIKMLRLHWPVSHKSC